MPAPRPAFPVAPMLALLIAVIALLPASPARAAGSVVTTGITLSRAEQRQLSALAAEALAKVAQAQGDLQAHHPDRALRDLAETRLLFDLVRAARPTAEVDAMLHYLLSEQELEGNQRELADLLPLYAALDAMPASAPVQAARRRLNAARQDLEQPARDQALDELHAMQQSLWIDDVDFPLHAADATVTRLVAQLTKGDAHIDDAALASVETNLRRIIRATTPHAHT